ncbi:MAG: GIY-YIG nuclease family protein [Mongoliitalea sp.]
MVTVYAISSKERKYIYVGLTSNLDDRLHRHNSGYERITKPYRPFKLIYTQEFMTRSEAREREKYLKTTSGKSFLRALEESSSH